MSNSTPASSSRRTRAALAALLALQAVWGCWFIYRTSFEVDGERYFCLYDDAMISMTFARNLVEGHGLCWGRDGDPVEGFTNPLWTYSMVGANLLPLPRRLRSLVVQVTSLLALMLTTLATYRLARRWSGSAAALAAAALTALYYPLMHWALRGFAMGVEALLMVVGVLLAADLGRGATLPRLFLVLTAASFVRMDMLPFVAITLVFVAWRSGGLVPRRPWVVGLALLVGTQLAYELFRLAWFGDPLPNPFYLKLTGTPLAVRVARGLAVFRDFATPLAPFLAVVLVAGLWLARRRRELLLAVAVVVAYLAYSIYTGGDAWEHSTVGANRFQCVVFPLLFAVAAAVVDAVARRATGDRRVARIVVAAVLFTVGFVVTNRLVLAPNADAHRRNVAVLDPPHAVERHRAVVEETLALARFLPERALVSVVWAGIPGFFTDFRLVDFLGFSDRHIARLPPKESLTVATAERYLPGHMKWDMEYVLGERRPDVVYQTWPPSHDYADTMARFGYSRHGLPVGAKRRLVAVWVRDDANLGKR